MGQILRYTARQLVSNHLTTDNLALSGGRRPHPLAEYLEATDKLKTVPSDADIALTLNMVGTQKTNIAGALWRLSLAERAARMTADERKAVSNFASTLKMQLSGGSEQANRKIDWIGMLKSLSKG